MAGWTAGWKAAAGLAAAEPVPATVAVLAVALAAVGMVVARAERVQCSSSSHTPDYCQPVDPMSLRMTQRISRPR